MRVAWLAGSLCITGLLGCGGAPAKPGVPVAKGPCTAALEAPVRLFDSDDPGGGGHDVASGKVTVLGGSARYDNTRRLLRVRVGTEEGWTWVSLDKLSAGCPVRIGALQAEGPVMASADPEIFVQLEPAPAVGGALVEEAAATVVAMLDIDGDKREDQVLDVGSPDRGHHGLVLARHTAKGWVGTVIAALIPPDLHYTYAFDRAVLAGGAAYLVVMVRHQGAADRQEAVQYALYRHRKNGEFDRVFEGTTWRTDGERWTFAAADGASLWLTTTNGQKQHLRWDAARRQLVGDVLGD